MVQEITGLPVSKLAKGLAQTLLTVALVATYGVFCS
jgi:hypothetical protein